MDTKEQNHQPSLKELEVWFLSFFGLGFARYAPGTFGTLGTLPIVVFLGKISLPVIFLIPILLLGIGGSCLLVEAYQRRYHVKDPSWIVIDEVLGFLTAWVIFPTDKIFPLALLFLAFRFFDIYKIWPASFFDQKVKHGAGVVLDDIVAGIFAGCLLRLLYFLINTVF